MDRIFQSSRFLLLAFLLYSQHDYGYIMFQQSREAVELAKPYLPTNPVILDAGAYDGAESLYFTEVFPHATVHAFEPIPELYHNLVTKTKKQRRISTYQLALGDFTGYATFHVSKDSPVNRPSGSSSLLAPKDHLIHAPHVAFYKTITVPVTTIDAWAAQYNIKKIDFMWLDMQGYELNALMASPHILKTVKVILSEVEVVEAYEGQYLYKDLKAFLEKEGFTMIAANFDVEGQNPHWSGDVLFVRTREAR